MINATDKGGGDYTPIESGTHVARCIQMVHLGTIEENIMGKKKRLNKVRISFETPLETKEFKEGEGEKPFMVSKDFTLSMNEKSNLRKFLEGWRSQGFTKEEAVSFDITQLLEKPCMLSVVHKTSASGRLYADIASASKLPKGMKCPPQVNPTLELNYGDEWSIEKFNSLPQFVQDKMRQSEEFNNLIKPEEMNAPQDEDGLEEDELSDLPF